MLIRSLDEGLQPHLDTTPLQHTLGVAPEVFRERAQETRQSLDKDDSNLRARNLVIVLAGHDLHQLGKRTRALDACGPTADDDEGEQRAAHVRVHLGIGTLQTGQHVVAKSCGVRQHLQAQRQLGDFLVAEVVVGAAAGEHQIVVWNVRTASNPDRLLGKVDAGHGRLPKPDVG